MSVTRAKILDCVLQKLRKRYDPGENVREGSRAVDHLGATSCHQLLVKCSFLDTRFKDDLKTEDISSAKGQLIDELERLSGHGKYIYI